MFIIKRFKNLPYVLIGVLGLLIASTSFYFLNNKYQEPIEMKEIVVTSRDIPMYEIIKSQDLKVIEVPATTNTDNYFTETSDIVGKILKYPVPSNEIFLLDSLLDKEEVENLSFITINTLYAKTGDARPGDIVDVYKVLSEKGDWVEGNQSYLVAEDVVVISLTDGNGKIANGGSRMPLGSSEKIETVKLGVKPSEVKHLVPASVLVDNGYVLVVKNSYTKETQDINRDPDLDNILNQNVEIQEGGEIDNDEIIQEIQEGEGNTELPGDGENN